MILTQDKQQEEAIYQEGFEDGYCGLGLIFKYQNNSTYLRGYIKGLEKRIHELENPFPIDEFCGF